jgi:HAD superfamily hydrolase (TIGR01490 family)
VKPRLALFDLDHTLIDGDSDELWCAHLGRRGLLAPGFAERSAALMAGYRDGRVDPLAFCEFHVATLAGRRAADWAPLLAEFLREAIEPRIKAGAAALVEPHRDDAWLVMTTATNRVVAAPTAQRLGFEHLIATECDTDADGVLTGRVRGTPNLRAGKLERLHGWLAARGGALGDFDSCAYSDSINDLPLLEAVTRPVAVDPDARLAAVAAERGWPVLRLV